MAGEIKTLQFGEGTPVTISLVPQEVGTPTGPTHAVNLAYLASIGAGFKNNISATTSPTINDDSGDGYSIGSFWIDVTNDKIYWVSDVTVGAALWHELFIHDKSFHHTNSTQSTDKDTGALVLEGGLGVEKNVNVGGNLVVQGDLTIQGTTTTLNTSTLDVEDANIVVNKNGTQSSANSGVAGLTVETDTTNARIGYDSTLASKFKAGNVASEAEVATVSHSQTFTNKSINAANNTLTNIDDAAIKANAGIVYSKLSLTNSIVNGDISNSAAIAYSKLALTASIVNADIALAAAIAYSKLNLAGTIVNADINASAAIAYSKLNLSASIVNADIASGAAIVYSKLNLSASIINADINASAAIAYSKLNLALSIVNGDISASAAIARAKIANGTAYGAVVNDSSGALSSVAPGTSGNVFTSDGTQWTSATPTAAPTSSLEISNVTISPSVSASALTVAIKTQAGSDASGASPGKVGFRSSTLTSGIYNQRSITAALSMVISSGSTLGHTNGNPRFIFVYLIDNAGTVEVAVSSAYYPDNTLVTTSAEGGAGAADSNTSIYSTTARTSVPLRMIGILKSTQTTAGTYASAPSLVELMPIDRPSLMCEYTSSDGKTIATGGVLVKYETKVIDKFDSYDPTTGIFTANNDGYYWFMATFDTNDATWTQSNSANCQFTDSGDTVTFPGRFNWNAQATTSSSFNLSLSVVSLRQMSKGDTCVFRINHNRTGGSVTLIGSSTYNTFKAFKLGEL